MRMTVRRNKPGFRVISIVFAVVLFCCHSTRTSYAMSIHKAEADPHNKKTHTANGLDQMGIPQSLEDDRPTKLQPSDADEDGEDVYVGSDEISAAQKTSPSKRRLGSTSRFHKRRADSADDSGEDAFDRKMREPRLRLHENTEGHLGNSRSRRSVNSAWTSDREVQQFKGGDIGRSLIGLGKRSAASSGSYSGNSQGTQSIVNDLGILAERLAIQQGQNIRRKLLELGKRSEPFYDSPSPNYAGKLSINNDIGILAERMAMQQRQEDNDNIRRRLIELGKRSVPFINREQLAGESKNYLDLLL